MVSLNNLLVEGFVLNQSECSIKLKTHYFEGNIPEQEPEIDTKDEYQKQLLSCYQSFVKAVKTSREREVNRKNSKGSKDSIISMISSEIEKEWGHDDYRDFATQYFRTSETDKEKFLEKSDLAKMIFKSLEKESGKGTSFTNRYSKEIYDGIKDLIEKQYFVISV